MNGANADIQGIFQLAKTFDSQGDHYNAVKLYKKVLRLAPDWSDPYVQLSDLYKHRREWKPAFHYSLRVVELNPQEAAGWYNLGISATAIKSWQMAGIAWRQLGLQEQAAPKSIADHKTPTIFLELQAPKGAKEIVSARVLDPAQAHICSVPQWTRDRGYGDRVLYDRSQIVGYRIAENKQCPVYRELDLLKEARLNVYQILLCEAGPEEIDLLFNLCYKSKLGFENWSNNTQTIPARTNGKIPEFYDHPDVAADEMPFVAIAAPGYRDVAEVLRTWSVVCARDYLII